MKNASFRIAILFVLLAYANTAALGHNDGAKPLTNDDVISMVKAGLTEDTIASAIDAQPSKFDISAAALLKLKKQGASAKLIDAMVSASRREQSPSGAPVSTAAGSSTAGEKSPEALRAEESQDPRLKQMSAEDRKYILDQGAYAVEYCKNNATLNGLYSCSCFSEKMVDARIKTNGERVRMAGRSGREPFTNLISKVDYRDCADPAKAEKYGSDRAYEVLKMDTQLSRPQIDQICACVGSSLAGGFKANPVPNTVAIDGLFNSALIPCREKAVGGGSSASAPQASSNQAQPAQSVPQTAGRQTVPAPQHRSIFDRLNQAQNRANDAIRGTTGTNPAQPSNQSPQSAPAPSGATNQQLVANDALYHAIITNDPAACVAAIERGAVVNSLFRGDPMLSTAAGSGLGVTKCLVEHGADVNAVSDFSGQHIYISVAYVAAEKGHFDIMSYLVEKGANPNAISGGDQSLLMFTIANGHIDSVKFLVEHGADINLTLKDFRGRPRTALTFARGLHHGEEVEYLEAHGAH
jgi:hypothetical protein